MLCVEKLIELELFQKLPSDRLKWICERATYLELAQGDILVTEGDTNQAFFC